MRRKNSRNGIPLKTNRLYIINRSMSERAERYIDLFPSPPPPRRKSRTRGQKWAGRVEGSLRFVIHEHLYPRVIAAVMLGPAKVGRF